MTPVIEVAGLTKRYGGQPVVDGISLHVDQGEIFGILGPNGAGKTTAVECMEGLRRRDSGQIWLEYLGIMAAWTLVAGTVAARFFRWEQA
jgi:ABC-type multidrug transport system ATPase subunit